MLIRNITNANITVTGVTMIPDEVIELSDLGTREQLRNNSAIIVTAFTNNEIQFEYTDGYIQNDLAKILALLQNGHMSIDVNETASRYYYLKDMLRIKKDDIVEKTFNGKLKSLSITPSNNDVVFSIITNDGIELQPETLSKKQTMEFDFGDGLDNPIIRITSSRTTEVDVFMEGSDCHCDTRALQRFINTWKEDRDEWLTDKPVYTCRWYDSNICGNHTLVEDDVNGHKAVLPYNRIDTNIEYKIYKNNDKEYTVEKLENGKWDPFLTERCGMRIKNVEFIEFADGIINLSTITSNSQNHIDDRLGD
jgi:hypothetical protein